MHRKWRLPKRQRPTIKEDPQNDPLADYRDRRPKQQLSKEERDLEKILGDLEDDN